MIGWLWRIVIGRFSACPHEWETIEDRDIFRQRDNSAIGKSYVLRCKKCGDLSHKSFIA